MKWSLRIAFMFLVALLTMGAVWEILHRYSISTAGISDASIVSKQSN